MNSKGHYNRRAGYNIKLMMEFTVLVVVEALWGVRVGGRDVNGGVL